MNVVSRETKVLCLAAATMCGGCQSVDRVFYRAERGGAVGSKEARVILAADFEPSTTHHAPWIGTVIAAESRSEQSSPPPSAPQPKPAPQSPTKEATPPKPKKSYSVPSEAVRRLVLSAVAATSTQTEIGEELTGGGREIGETASARAGLIESLGARPGLSAPPPAIGFAVGGQAGLQQGFAGGLGLSRNGPTLFSLPDMPVRVRGADGRCNDLVNAGFFPDRGACEGQLGARKRR